MHLGWGSVLSIILYFPIVFLSSMGIFSNIVDAKNKATYLNLMLYNKMDDCLGRPFRVL